MNHSFDIAVAKEYGMAEAVIIANFQFWIAKNKANGAHLREGRTWTYNSVKALTELFPYMTDSQIRRVLERLVDLNVLVCANHNDSTYDRTKWYAFFDESIWLPSQIHLSKMTNGFGKSDKTVNTDVNTDSKPDNRLRTDVRQADIDELVKLGVQEQVAIDWLKIRKAKRAPLTPTALEALAREAKKVGLSIPDAVLMCAERGWQSLRADFFQSKRKEPDLFDPAKPKFDNWHKSDDGILRKGLELKKEPRPGESMAQYKARLFEELNRNGCPA